MNAYTLHGLLSQAITSLEEKAHELQCTPRTEDATIDILKRQHSATIELSMPVYRGEECEGDVFTFIEIKEGTATLGDVLLDPDHMS